MMDYDFDRQKPIDNYIIDFFCDELKLAIEIDGASHIDNEKKDKIRQQKLEEYGIRFLRFADKEVKTNIQSVLHTIKGWIEENKIQKTTDKNIDVALDYNYYRDPFED
jgi:very-short-patch-repair endonuclease